MPRAAFPARSRLAGAADFKRVFEAPDARASNADMLLLARRNVLPQARLGLIVGRKVSPLATQRNRIKRQCREAFRHRQRELQGFDIVMLARTGLAGCDNATIREHLDQLCVRLVKRLTQSPCKE